MGGGIYCEESSPLIIHNLVKLDRAAIGAGICCSRSTSIIRHNTLIRNIADGYGGGILCWCSSPLIDSCTIADNNGDGICCQISSDPTIHYNNILDNVGNGVGNLDSTIIIDARYNWWGDTSGPGGFGPGLGDEVSRFVAYDPWLYEPPGAIEEKHPQPYPIQCKIWPNPFRDRVNIIFLATNSGNYSIVIYDVSGRLVKEFDSKNINTIRNKSSDATATEFCCIWNGRDQNGFIVPGGVYLLRLQSGDYALTQKLLFLK